MNDALKNLSFNDSIITVPPHFPYDCGDCDNAPVMGGPGDCNCPCDCSPCR